MKELIENELNESIQTKRLCFSIVGEIERIARLVIDCYKNGGKVILFGNGGSAADAQHIAAELVCKLQKDRNALPAVSLTTNTSILTAQSNDNDYASVFERQVMALANKKDVVIGITTSGNSENVIMGIKKAKNIGARCIVLTGNSGGKIDGLADVTLKIPSKNTQRIQEAHITIGHIICGLVENELFG